MADPQVTQPSFDVDGARKAGYSDDEIAQHLAQTRGFDYQGAIKAGYTPADVLQHLSGQQAPATHPTSFFGMRGPDVTDLPPAPPKPKPSYVTDEANKALAGTGITVNPLKMQGAEPQYTGSDMAHPMARFGARAIPAFVGAFPTLDEAVRGALDPGMTSPDVGVTPQDGAGEAVKEVTGIEHRDAPGVIGELAALALKLKGGSLVQNSAAARTVSGAVAKGAESAKSALTVSDNLKRAAAQVPDASTTATAQRTVGDIHQTPIPNLTQRAGSVLDRHAAQLGVDTTNEAALSTKAELAGRASKAAGQKLYAQLDQAAAETAGAPGGNFQRYAETVHRLERESLDPSLTAAQGEALTERLNNARTEFETFKQEMIKRGLSEATIKQADKYWAKGAALDEVSRSFLNAEDASGNIKPTARPLDTQIKKLTAPASGRGHILKQALSGDAGEVANAAKDARASIEAAKVEKAAAQKSIKSATESAAAAQKRVDAIHGRQKAILKGAAGTVGLGGVAAAYSGVKSVLSHERGDR